MPNALCSPVFLVERTLRLVIPTRSGLETMRCLPLASVLILGACSSSTEPHVGRWTSDAAMPTPRGQTVAGVIDGIVYVAGGYVALTGAVATLEAYDPVANTWTTKAPMPVARYGTVAGVVNGILYVTRGSVLQAYDPATDTWTMRAPPTPTQGNNAVAGVLNDTLYVVGGYVGATATVLTTVEAYDPVRNTWTTKARMPTPRYGAAGGVVNGILYVAGGLDSNGVALRKV